MSLTKTERSNDRKRHFIELADVLRAERPGANWDPNKMVQWELDFKAIAAFCRRNNPRFNSERWFAYLNGECGPSGGAIKKVA